MALLFTTEEWSQQTFLPRDHDHDHDNHFQCFPASSSCDHSLTKSGPMAIGTLDVIKMFVQDGRANQRYSEGGNISDDESVSSAEDRDFTISRMLSRRSTFGTAFGGAFGMSRSSTFDDHQLADMGRVHEGRVKGVGEKRGGKWVDLSESEVPFGHLVDIDVTVDSEVDFEDEKEEIEKVFMASGPSLGIFCACKHDQLGGSMRAYEVNRRWVVFEFCRMKCEMDRRRDLFLPHMAGHLLKEETVLWEQLRDITVGRYMRRVREVLEEEVASEEELASEEEVAREAKGVMEMLVGALARQIPAVTRNWLGLEMTEAEQEFAESDVEEQQESSELEEQQESTGLEEQQESNELDESGDADKQQSAIVEVPNVDGETADSLAICQPELEDRGCAESRDTDRGCRSVSDRLFTENSRREIRVPRGLRRAAGDEDDDELDGDGDNGGDGDSPYERNSLTLRAENRPANIVVDPVPPILRYDDYSAYSGVLKDMKDVGGPELDFKGHYVDKNIEIGLLKDYKEHVEEKIDFSDEDGARTEPFYLDLLKNLEIDLREVAADLGRDIVKYEKTLDEYKVVADEVHRKVKKELLERRKGPKSEWNRTKRMSQWEIEHPFDRYRQSSPNVSSERSRSVLHAESSRAAEIRAASRGPVANSSTNALAPEPSQPGVQPESTPAAEIPTVESGPLSNSSTNALAAESSQPGVHPESTRAAEIPAVDSGPLANSSTTRSNSLAEKDTYQSPTPALGFIQPILDLFLLLSSGSHMSLFIQHCSSMIQRVLGRTIGL